MTTLLPFGMGQLRWWALWVAYGAVSPAFLRGVVIAHLFYPFFHRAAIAVYPFESWTALCRVAKYQHDLVPM